MKLPTAQPFHHSCIARKAPLLNLLVMRKRAVIPPLSLAQMTSGSGCRRFLRWLLNKTSRAPSTQTSATHRSRRATLTSNAEMIAFAHGPVRRIKGVEPKDSAFPDQISDRRFDLQLEMRDHHCAWLTGRGLLPRALWRSLRYHRDHGTPRAGTASASTIHLSPTSRPTFR